MTRPAHRQLPCLRSVLGSGHFVAFAGAHDALSATLAARAGFPALWASGLGISTVVGAPDSGILGMREVLRAAQGMTVASGLPVLVDCDSGFGDARNVSHMVRLFENAGIGGVCLEDKAQPKRNSLSGAFQRLEKMEVFAGKVTAAKESQTGNLVVVARIEALVVGAGNAEAHRRARAYCDAGADAVLVHSVCRRPDEIAEFASLWNLPVPLLALPTMYPSVTEDQLEALGISGCIYANQALRASAQAIIDGFTALRRDRSALNLESRIASVSDVLDINEGMTGVIGPHDAGDRGERRDHPEERRVRIGGVSDVVL